MKKIEKPAVITFEYADAALQEAMKPQIRALEEQRWSEEAMTAFGADAERQYRQIVSAIEAFLCDPTSPEADQKIKDQLRDQYIAAAEGLALTLGAGQEVLRRYESDYLEQAAEELMINDDPEMKQVKTLIKCRDALDDRLQVLAAPEKSHDFVCAAIARLEMGRQFSTSLAQGLPLDEAINVRRSPLKLQMPGARLG